MPWFKWSQTANSNASADATINWAEGQPPRSINDSARAMMAASAMYRDDIAGAIVTGGTSTAYTVSSFSAFDSLADMNGQQVWFTPHVTNGTGPVLLNVDSLGQKPLRSSPNVELGAGALILGAPYGAVYNNTDGAWYLKGFYGNPGFSTGDIKPTLKTTADPGWVMGGSQSTIGNVGSGANYAHADALALFTLIWNNISSPTANGFCAVVGGLGASAAADWAGLKKLDTGWYTGHALGMAGSGGGLTMRALGSDTRNETSTLSTTNLPPIPYTPQGSINIALGGSTPNVVLTPGSSVGVGGTASGGQLETLAAALSGGLSFAGTTAALGGSSTPVSIVQPTTWVNVMIKL